MPCAANAVNQAEDAARNKTPVDGTRPGDSGAKKDESILEGHVRPQKPVAQQENLDEPTPGSLRDQAQDAQAKAENTPPPAEETAAPQSPQPLPDLRQGIPSTFDFEFGGKTAQEQSERPSEQTDGVDITAAPEEQRGSGGERGEREYNREDYETSLDRKRAQMANWLYIAILTLATSGAFYLARPFNAREEVPSNLEPDDASGWSPGKMYARIRARLGSQVGYYTEPTFPKLLPEVPAEQRQPFTLVLSLEDLMVHSSWDRTNGYRVAKRPGIDYFIRYLSQYYELVLFTSVPLAMADPVIKKLDPYHFIMWPLGREATKYDAGEYVKDLSYLNRPLNKTLIIDTHAAHVKNQPENAIILPKWSGDPKDPHTKDLVALIPFLEYIATMGTDDVRTVLKSFEGKDIAVEFARRESEARKEFNRQLAEEQKKRPRFSIGSLAGSLGVSSGGMGGGMVLADGQSVAEGLRQGKMLPDQIREQGQKQYEHLEKQIREHGAQWLKEEEEEQKRLMEASMRDMKKGAFSWFGGGG
ncbi:HAD-like protein [Teratosphaeria nubilosa]|uniref:Mitochondrial import inner membrane translocase subunit TIM50 n=1 Tax=Teratosphaeria nubilosa TaxID=161662 RepID=A0A6G1KW85_9PEZI|nr:HAD-like protein [Teratosphaeria nubilosa]